MAENTPATPREPGGTRVRDPRILRAIAHPVRNRILGEMAAIGPSRAADLARELDIPANQASFHLRQLAKYGLVEEAPDEARDKRDRVWKLVAEDGLSLNLGEMTSTPGGAAAVKVFSNYASGWGHQLVDEAYRLTDPDQSIVRMVSDSAIRLTQDQARELTVELSDLVTRWSEKTRGKGEGQTYVLFQVLQPYPTPQVDGR